MIFQPEKSRSRAGLHLRIRGIDCVASAILAPYDRNDFNITDEKQKHPGALCDSGCFRRSSSEAIRPNGGQESRSFHAA